jgi:hypothetical protein
MQRSLVVGVLVTVVLACSGGGPGTPDTRVGNDPAPISNDLGTPSNACFACTNWVCGDNPKTKFPMTPNSDGCYVNGLKIDTCGTVTYQVAKDVPTTLTGDATHLRVCYSLTQASAVCTDCVPAK